MLIFNRYAIEQQVMKGFIADDQIGLYAWACNHLLQQRKQGDGD
jgi:hypothetical protein